MTDSHDLGQGDLGHGALGQAGGSWSPLAGSAQAVVLDILVHGARPRTELATRLGLSGPSLTRITKPLLESGLLVERPSLAPSGSGRPSVPLDLDPDAHHFVGVKLTRDRLFVVVTDQRGRVLGEHDEPLPDPSPAAVVARSRPSWPRPGPGTIASARSA